MDIENGRNISYTISVQDGSGPDVNGNLSTTHLGNISINPQIQTNLVEPDAIGADQATTQIPLFGNIDLTGNGLPSSIELRITDFVDGDILGSLGTSKFGCFLIIIMQKPYFLLHLENLTMTSSFLIKMQCETFYTTINDA